MSTRYLRSALLLTALTTASAFAQTAPEANKQPTQSLAHGDVSKQAAQSMAHADPGKQHAQSLAHSDLTKQKAQSLSHGDPGSGLVKQQ